MVFTIIATISLILAIGLIIIFLLDNKYYFLPGDTDWLPVIAIGLFVISVFCGAIPICNKNQEEQQQSVLEEYHIDKKKIPTLVRVDNNIFLDTTTNVVYMKIPHGFSVVYNSDGTVMTLSDISKD